MKKIIDDAEDVITIEELHKRLIIKALEKNIGRIDYSAEDMGVHYKWIRNRIKQFNLADYVIKLKTNGRGKSKVWK